MKKKENIVLIGFMGSGKTTVGLKLSWKMKMPVEDTDKLIERREKRTISSIFATDGEAVFRQMETALLEELCESKYERILSVGGGTPVLEANRPLLKKLGRVVYLRIKPETVYERVKEDTGRPLLQCEDPLGRIKELMAKRASAYEECADLIIDVDGLTIEQIVERITAK